ncbi:MAG: aromatic aminobenezylarsenical efflux permease ArsG family transporter [Bacteroides sp.]|nr:aromatic aminobenezylarsenical efflux permease ArsG family transporter [Roseburia sp.]MCM1347248.1 aromatic aminobenezylarsenical efflux permease ArsG family transporter [Bacteroides sp.]MCM1421749.1 aromatic aminobenezylarsenical efflux permease ArsG family transporter [Bacteroides sp.]
MEWMQNVIDSGELPLLSALVLGLLTAVSPCPLATNITAVAYISKNIEQPRKVLYKGLLYSLGRIAAYFLLGAVLIYIIREGADTFSMEKTISKWGEVILGPALFLIGLFMLVGKYINLPKLNLTSNIDGKKFSGFWGSFALGVLFALAFCPSSGLFYFGLLIPMSATASGGYLLPLAFGVATSLPVIAVAWIIAYSVSGVSKFYNRMQTFQKWLNLLVAIVFIGVGIYYTIINY